MQTVGPTPTPSPSRLDTFSATSAPSATFMEVGAAPDYEVITVLQETLLTLGGPAYGAFAGVVSIVACGLFVAGLRHLWSEQSDEWFWFCYSTAIVIAPALFILLVRAEFLTIRYLFGSVVFFLSFSAGCEVGV